jgi:hypothetical protein
MRLVLSRTPEQEAALETFLGELQNPASPNYHRGLTPEQFGKLYGPADSDISALVAWLESHGFKIETVPAGRTNIAFSGTVAQVEEAFHTTIHAFNANGEEFTSNTVDPSIPTALTSVVSGVAHLSSLHPRAHHSTAKPGILDGSTNRLVPAERTRQAEKSHISPNYTDGGNFLYITPGDAATIYDTPNSFNANFTSGTSATGTNIKIGVGGDGLIQASTVANYRSTFTGSTASVTIINVDGVVANGDTDEAYIDTELTAGLAPAAAIYFYASTDLFSAVDKAVTDNTVDIFSLSFGACELDFTTSDNSMINSWWSEAAGQMQTITVSTGDSGSAGCDATADTNGNNIPTASEGLAVNGLASTPYNIAVGGTDTDGLLNGFSTYVSTSAGTAATYYRTAKNYIPESTWNNSTQSDTTVSLNFPYTGTDANIVGGSGGKSSCSTNSTTTTTLGSCTKGYAKPTWQRGAGVPADGVRDLPDVSLMAGNGYDAATWLICTDDTFVQQGTTYTTNCSNNGTGFAFTGFGGTSTASPAFAGILALVAQSNGRLGQAALNLYDLYNGSHSSTVFHDITVGNNSVSCVPGSPNCTQNSNGYYYESGYDTTTGYDLATGIGSVDATNLITYWKTAVGITAAKVTLTPSATSITPAQSVNIAVAVTGGSGTPTGTVALSGGGYTATGTLAAGAYTFTIPAGSLSTGADTLTVTYSGDPTYGSSTGTTIVTVTPPPAPVVTLSPTSLTFSSTNVGSNAPIQTVILKNTGNATLNISGVTVGGTNASSFTQTNTCGTSVTAGVTCAITVTFIPTASGTLTATISIADNAAGSPQTVSLTGTGVKVVSGSFSLAATAVTVTKGSSGTSTVTVTPAGGYTGSVLLTCSVAPITGGTHTPTCSGSTVPITGAAAATGTITVSTTAPSSSAQKALKAKAENHTGGILGGTVALACIVFFGVPAKRKAWKSFLSVLVLVAGLSVLEGCGGGGGGTVTPTDPGTTSGNYTITVTGTDSVTPTLTSSTTFTLTVQ